MALEPASDPDHVRQRLTLTLEAVAFARDGGSLALTAPDDLVSLLARALAP